MSFWKYGHKIRYPASHLWKLIRHAPIDHILYYGDCISFPIQLILPFVEHESILFATVALLTFRHAHHFCAIVVPSEDALVIGERCQATGANHGIFVIIAICCWYIAFVAEGSEALAINWTSRLRSRWQLHSLHRPRLHCWGNYRVQHGPGRIFYENHHRPSSS